MQVTIQYKEKSGTVQWSEESFEGAVVNFPDQEIADRVTEFLNTKRTFRIPQSQTTDDFEKVEACPDDGLDYLELGLCELRASTGVFVEW